MTEAERIRQEHMAALAQAAENAKAAQAELNRAVEAARGSRLSWNHIALAVGISRQGARQKWAA